MVHALKISFGAPYLNRPTPLLIQQGIERSKELQLRKVPPLPQWLSGQLHKTPNQSAEAAVTSPWNRSRGLG